MTRDDQMMPAAGRPRSTLAEAAIVALLGFGVIFSTGAMVGFIAAAAETGPGLLDFAIGGVLLLVTGLCGWQLVLRAIRLLRRPREKVGPSVQKVRSIWTFFITVGLIVGGMIGAITAKSTEAKPAELTTLLFSSAPVSPVIAMLMLAGLVLATIGTVVFYRYIDELERAAHETASLLAFNVYIVAVMGWWTAAKGQLVPPVHHGAIFALVLAVWFAAWLWRRYR